jgi:hypothetical protein
MIIPYSLTHALGLIKRVFNVDDNATNIYNVVGSLSRDLG